MSEIIDTEGQGHGGDLPPTELEEMLEAGNLQLIDVRRDHEFEAGHIAGASHVEINDLQRAAEDLDKEKPVVIYCRSGSRSELAADALRDGGFDARALEGGVLAWSHEGRSIEPKGGYVAAAGEAAAVLEQRRGT